MKKFFAEFKKFISRGNVVDLAVGVIIGGAFSAIVTALTNQILMPLINWFLAVVTGGKGMEGAVTMLQATYTTAENGEQIIDLANSIYIDWGAFISAIINFLLIAFVLFLIVKAINKVNDGVKKSKERFAPLSKDEVKALRKEGKTFAEIEALAKEKAAADEEAARIAAEEAAANAPKTEQQLLSEIVELLRNK
ncbi:MAG: large conductance mechanosensitive channel protein MscL [Clostridiales bacterium]|nr:large conductance mechanosensitive channel protein MscL [Clostridiales bacterium]